MDVAISNKTKVGAANPRETIKVPNPNIARMEVAVPREMRMKILITSDTRTGAVILEGWIAAQKRKWRGSPR